MVQNNQLKTSNDNIEDILRIYAEIMDKIDNLARQLARVPSYNFIKRHTIQEKIKTLINKLYK